jgi:hypothetical protein
LTSKPWMMARPTTKRRPHDPNITVLLPVSMSARPPPLPYVGWQNIPWG